MKALIFETQVCQLSEDEFPVAPPLHWVDAPAEVTTRYSYVYGQFIEPEETEE